MNFYLKNSCLFLDMITPEKRPEEQIIDIYRTIVAGKYPDRVAAWPVLSGYNSKIGSFCSWLIVILEHSGNPGMISYSGLGELHPSLIGANKIDSSNKEFVRSNLERNYHLKPTDAVVFVDPHGEVGNEFNLMLQKHEYAMGLIPMKIFLSHKGIDKEIIREYKQTLKELGFDPWLDEDAMSAGTNLERGILQGFKDSCAAVFFVTPNFQDQNYLASEVNYAMAEKRSKDDRFSIITLVFNIDEKKGVVPDLLRQYVWKEPRNDLEGLREIIRALPIKVGDVYWKHP